VHARLEVGVVVIIWAMLVNTHTDTFDWLYYQLSQLN